MKKEMKSKKTKDTGMSAGAMIAIGASVAALAAGGYYFFGPEGKKHRGKLKGWMIKMKGEIVEKMENAKDLTQAAYEKIIDGVAAKYLKNTTISAVDVKTLVDRLKRDWKGIVRTGAPKKAAKAAVKKAPAKKAAKKKTA